MQIFLKEYNFVKENKLLSREEAAKYLGVSPKTLQAWQTKEHSPDSILVPLPYVKVGHLVKYKLSDLNDFIKRQTVL